MKSKKEIINNSVLIILSYILLFVSNNFKMVIKTILGGQLDNSLEFINLPILLSLIILALVIIFRKYLFKNKINLWIVFCTILVYNFSQGYFLGFDVSPFIILYIYILLITYTMIVITKKEFEISIITGFSTLLLITFFFGMFGFLNIIKYVLVLSVIAMIIYLYKKYKHSKKELIEAKEKLFSNGFIIFNILWMIAVLGGAGMYVHSWDEYSHWAYDAKATIYYSKFGASQEIMSKTKGYAPIFTIWHYIVAIFNGFSEHNLYVGLSMLISIFLLPAFHWIKKNSVITQILGVIAITFCCYIFSGVYNFSSLYADLAITVIFSSIIIIYNISKKENMNLNLPIILLLIIVTLSKSNGFVIAFVALLIMLMQEILNEKMNLQNIIKCIFEFIKKRWNLILAVILTLIMWKTYLFVMSKITTEYYDYILIPEDLKADLSLKMNFPFISNFLKKVLLAFDEQLTFGILKLSMWQFLILIFSSLFLIFYFENKKSIIKATKNTIPYIVGYMAFFGLTVLAMFVMMTKYEASILASFGRYLNWFHLGISIFILSYIFSVNYFEKKEYIVIIILITIIINIPFSNLTYFIYNSDRSDSYNIYLKRFDKFKTLRDNTEDEAMVYVIDQKDGDGIMAMWYARYYGFPRKINASSASINWKIKTTKNVDDLKDWGFTAKQWIKNINDYGFEYVYLYSSDDEFFKETEFLYDDITLAKKSTLFRVKTVNKETKLIPIK